MIKLENISFEYDNGTKVFEDFSLDVRDGEITCVTGESGSGKTTLLNILSKSLRVQSGTVINESQNVSYVYQEPRLINEKTVFQNLDCILSVHEKNKSTRKDKILAMLQSVNLTEADGKKYPLQLSGGMAQRVSLIRAFLTDSDLLLLDEPFKGLDKELKQSVIEFFLKLYNTHRRTVVLVTHDEDEAKIASSVKVLNSINKNEEQKSL